MTDDERLKHAFDKLREDDARRAPSFESVRQRLPRKRSPWAIAVPVASAMAAAAVLVVWCNASNEAAPTPTATRATPMASSAPMGGESLGAAAAGAEVDEAPLDFLLAVPGLRGTPNFDTSLLRGSLR